MPSLIANTPNDSITTLQTNADDAATLPVVTLGPDTTDVALLAATANTSTISMPMEKSSDNSTDTILLISAVVPNTTNLEIDNSPAVTSAPTVKDDML